MARLELQVDASRVQSGTRVARAEIDGVKRSAEAAERSLESMGRDGSRAARQLAVNARSAAQGFRSLGGGQIQNVAFQIGDFATQVGAGTRASVALGQQLPQLLGGFGAIGAVAGAAVAVLVPLAASFLDTAEAAQSFDEALADLEGAVDDARAAIQRQKASAEDLAEVYGTVDQNLRNLLATQSAIALSEQAQELSDAARSLEAGPLARAVLLLDQISAATGPAALGVIELRGQFEALPAPIRSAAEAFVALREADSTEEQQALADALRQELEALDSTDFQSLIGALADLDLNARRALQNVRIEAAETSAALQNFGGGRSGAGPGGPLINSTDAQFLRQLGSVPSDAGPARGVARRSGGGGGGASRAARELEQQARAYERLRGQLDPAFRAQTQFNSAVEILNGQLAAGKISQEEYNDVLAQATDRFNEAIAASNSFTRFIGNLSDQLKPENIGLDSLRTFNSTLTDVLTNPFQRGESALVSFVNSFQSLFAQLLSAQVTRSFANLFGGFFGGAPRLFDAGGTIPAGGVGIVAERRPEIVNGSLVSQPTLVRGPANVTGGRETSQRLRGGAPQINNIITFDVNEVMARIAQHPDFEQNVVNVMREYGAINA